MQPSPRNIIIRIVFAVIGVLVGVSILLSFGIVWNNWNCAAWGFVSAIFAFSTLVTHVEYRRDQWDTRYKLLLPLQYIGCAVQLVGIVAFTVYITIAAQEHQAVTPDGRGFYVAAVWCFMTWKWGFWQFWSARQYKRLYIERNGNSFDYSYEKM